MSVKVWPSKDKDEELDYGLKWASRLSTDILTASTWILPSGITKFDESFTDTITTIWLSGGTDGETYTLLNRVTTQGGRKYDQSVKLKVKEK